PAVEGRIDDVDGFLARAFWEERPALTGRVRWSDVLPGLLEEWGIGDALDEVLAVWLSIEEVPGTHDLVRALRAGGVACFLATNQDERRAEVMHEQLRYGDLMDGEFYSCAMGVAKPDPDYFRVIAQRLDRAPRELLLLDDNVANVEAARSVGVDAEVWSYREDLSVLRDHLARRGLPVG
ncbi:MAG: HAD-IA family hydrolase, partial [Nocardioidaceae bacterium]